MAWTKMGWIDQGDDWDGLEGVEPLTASEIVAVQMQMRAEDEHDAENALRAAAGLPSLEEELSVAIYNAQEVAYQAERESYLASPRGQWWFKPGSVHGSGRLICLGYHGMEGDPWPDVEAWMEPWQEEACEEISQVGSGGWIYVGTKQVDAAVEEVDYLLNVQRKDAARQHVRAQRAQAAVTAATGWAAAQPDPTRIVGVDYDEDRSTFVVRAEVTPSPMINLTVHIDANGGVTYDPE